jgi:hypothetical protein
VIAGHGAGSRRRRPSGREEGLEATQPLLVLIGHHAIDGIADDRRERDTLSTRLLAEPSHLLLCEGDLGADHARMITVSLMVM